MRDEQYFTYTREAAVLFVNLLFKIEY